MVSGAIEPLVVTGPFVKMHNTDGTLKAGIPTASCPTVAIPSAPVAASIAKIADPTHWLTIAAYDWVSYIDELGVRQVESLRGVGGAGDILPIQAVVYGESEIYVAVYVTQNTYTFPNGGPYNFVGPRFQFQLTADVGGVYGGPDTTRTIPANVTEFDDPFPKTKVPLVNTDGEIYAYFECVDADMPLYDEEIIVTDTTDVTYAVPSGNGWVWFKIDMNYPRASREERYYVATAVDDDDLEGPPSELSEKIILKPGEKLTLTLDLPEARTNLYRAGDEKSDFFLVEDLIATTSYEDNKLTTQDVELPPYGNHPGAIATFLEGSIIHPAQFGVAFLGNILYFSDFYRHHAWPEEWTMELTEGAITAIALTGNTVLVFTTDATYGDNVYAVSGGNPEKMIKSLIASNAALLAKAALCRDGDTVIWATYDGLAASDGGSPKILTGDYFTRDQWLALTPSTMKFSVADRSVFMERASGDHYRFQMGEGEKALTTYSTVAATSLQWKSKREWFEQATAMDAIRVSASVSVTNPTDVSVTAKIYADRSLVKTQVVPSEVPIQLGTLAPAHEWEVQLESAGRITNATLFEREVRTVDEQAALTIENVPAWRSVYTKFMDKDRFSGGSLAINTTDSADIEVYVDGSLQTTKTVTNGAFFTLPRTLPKGTLWRWNVKKEARVDSLTLFRRQTVPASNVIREVKDAVPAWLVKKYEYPGKTKIGSVSVDSDTYPVTMHYYLDGSESESGTVTIASANEQIFSDATECISFEYDFGGSDAEIREVVVYQVVPNQIGPDGVDLTHPTNTRNLRYSFEDVGVWACGAIKASSYTSMTLTVYADNNPVPVWTYTVADGTVFQFPRDLAAASIWTIDIDTTADVERIILKPWTRVPVQDNVVRVVHPDTIIPPWMYTRYELTGGRRLGAIKVVCKSYTQTARVFYDGAQTVDDSISITNRTEQRVDPVALAGDFSIDFSGNDHLINELWCFIKQEIQENVVTINGPTFRANLRKFSEPNTFAAGVVTLSSYGTATLNLYANGALEHTATVTSGVAFSLPKTLSRAVTWGIDLTCDETTIEPVNLTLVPWRRIAANGPIRAVGQTGEIPEWMYTIYEFSAPTRIRSARLKASASATLSMYADMATSATETLAMSTRHEYAVATPFNATTLQFDFDYSDRVQEILIFPQEILKVDKGGLILRPSGGYPAWRNKTLVFKDTGSFAVARISCTSYTSLTMKLSTSGTVRQTVSISDNDEFKLATNLPDAREWELDLAHQGDVNEFVLVARDFYELKGGMVSIRKEDDPFTWLGKRVLANRPVQWQCIRVSADAYPVTVRIYVDGVLEYTGTITTSEPVRLPRLTLAREYTMDVSAAETIQVHEVRLATSMDYIRAAK